MRSTPRSPHFPNSIIRLFDYSIIKFNQGFTLIELLVVIAIIGTLTAVLVTSFGSGTESARAAQCLTNMRNLAQGVISVAAKESYFPPAGSHALIGMNSSGKTLYYERVGWISWLSKNDEYATRTHGKSKPTGFVNCENVSAYHTGKGEDADGEFALSNGKIWTAVGKERTVYQCPEHVRRARRKNVSVRFSYAMNAAFGYDSTRGSDAIGTLDGSDGVWFNTTRLDRKLLFAELPIGGSPISSLEKDNPKNDSYSTGGGDSTTDCILQYKATVNGSTYNSEWKGQAEAIAFNHKSGKRRCAHVVFADGHAEQLLAPRTAGGLNDEQLTALLCAGEDIGFDGKEYKKLDR